MKKTIATNGNRKEYLQKPIVFECLRSLGLKQSLLAMYL
jgi:hypothetical protein